MDQQRKQAGEFRDGIRTGHRRFTDAARTVDPRLADAPDTPDGWARFTLAQAQAVAVACPAART
jgi:hypothetical protein